MIPDFADERINEKIRRMMIEKYGRADYIVALGIKMTFFAMSSTIELYFWDIRGKFAKVEYDLDDEPYCWMVDGWHHTGISSAKLMEYLMSLSDELGEWLLWNRIL